MTADDQTGVEARSANVGADHVAELEAASELGRALGSRDRAREDRLEGSGSCLLERHRAAA